MSEKEKIISNFVEIAMEGLDENRSGDEWLTGYGRGCRDGAVFMYDQRQREINRLHIVINRICGAVMDNDMAEIRRLVDAELSDDATAKRVMENE